MTKQELTQEINHWASSSEPQSEQNLDVLYVHYCEMFLEYVGDLPEFKIVDTKGRIELQCEKQFLK